MKKVMGNSRNNFAKGLLIACVAAIAIAPIHAKKKTEKGFQPVSVKREIQPFYPNWAYNNGIGEGFAKVAFYVDEYGTPSDFLVVEYSHEAFADSLLSVLPNWKFEPAHQFGNPVKSVCHAYWEFLPNRPIYTNVLLDTSKRIDRKDAHMYRELKYYDEKKLDAKLRMVSFPEIVAPRGFDKSKLKENKVQVTCQFYVDKDGSVALPVVTGSSAPELNEKLAEAFKAAAFDRPFVKREPAIAWMEKTYLVNVTAE